MKTYTPKKIFEYIILLFSIIYLGLFDFSMSEVYNFNALSDRLYSLKTRIKPQISNLHDITIITISDRDIEQLEGSKQKVLSTESVSKMTQQILRYNPKAVGIILPSQDFKVYDENVIKLFQQFKDTPHLYWGTTGLLSFTGNNSITKSSPLPKNVLSARIKQPEKEMIKYFFLSPNELISTIAINHAQPETINNIVKIRDGSPNEIHLNYDLPQTFTQINSIDIFTQDIQNKIENKFVLVGYTAFRTTDPSNVEFTHRFTPWHLNFETITPSNSSPAIFISAVALRNLLQNKYLKKPPNELQLVQIIFVSLLCFVVWFTTPVKAIFLIVLILATLIYVNAMFMTFYNVFFSTGNTLVFAFIATLIGAFWRGQKDNKSRLHKILKLESQKKMAFIQENFINKFASDLFTKNHHIKETLESHQHILNSTNKTEQQTYIQALGSTIELEEFLNGLKQFASLDTFEINKPKKNNINLTLLFKKLLKQFESNIKENQLNINLEFENETLFCWSDNLYLEPIFFNLLSNAIKYSPKQGQIKISCKKNKFNLTIFIYNDGPGIAKEHQERIFEKFYRVKDDRVYKIKGNGLGLYLAQFFANKIGTTISLQSEIDQGATFFLEIEKGKN